MKILKSISIILLFSVQTGLIAQDTSQGIDLVIKKSGSDKQIIGSPGQEIKIWLNDGSTYSGKFETMKSDTLIFENLTYFLSKDIKKIRVYSQAPFNRAVGRIFIIAGTGGMALGGLTLVAGLAALASESLGAIVLVATPVLGGLGFGFFKLGSKLHGSKVNLNRRWRIEVAK